MTRMNLIDNENLNEAELERLERGLVDISKVLHRPTTDMCVCEWRMEWIESAMTKNIEAFSNGYLYEGHLSIYTL